MLKETNEKLLYRRQYVLSPHHIKNLDNWNEIQITKNYYLTSHPDLEVTEVHHNDLDVYLLGFIINPFNPKSDNYTIMQDVVVKSKCEDDLFANIYNKCGRYVIIVKKNNSLRIFSDACGTRQVFYHFDKNKSVWCSSQPHIIANQLNIEFDKTIQKDLLQTYLFRSGEHWYPGELTLFGKIFHLTPNHYLDINTSRCERYWPRKRLKPIDINDCIQNVSKILSGIIEGALHRFNLAFAISSGFDSRTLFSTSKKVAEKIHFFSQTSESLINIDPDVLIPSAMLNKLGLKHSIISPPKQVDEDFKTILQKNVFTARKDKILNANAVHNLFKNENKEFVIMYGNCSEITKRDRFRFPKTPKALINGTVLASMALMSQSNIAVEEFSKWLSSVKKLTRFNVDILDLMHWEQRVGNWGAMTFSEYETVHESICPYSCRAYIEYMLRVPFIYRTNPKYKLHHDIIKANWPEALEYAINPTAKPLVNKIENLLYRLNLYDPIKFLHIMLYKRFK